MRDPYVHEYREILVEEEDLLSRATQHTLKRVPPKFIALRAPETVRSEIDLRVLAIKCPDTVRIIESEQGPWYWLLFDITRTSSENIERIRQAADTEQLENPPPALWELADPIKNMWQKQINEETEQ